MGNFTFIRHSSFAQPNGNSRPFRSAIASLMSGSKAMNPAGSPSISAICKYSFGTYLGLDSEEKYKNNGVSACAVCDGALPIYRKKPLAVIGAGDSAVEEATYLANLDGAATIYMIVRRDEMRASKVMQDRAKNHPNIEIIWNHVVQEVRGDGKLVNGLQLASTVDDSTRDLEVGGMFVAIGHTPNTGFLAGAVEMNDAGYIQWTKPFRTNTSVDGVFAAGDVADDYYRQAITSAGTGCMAALDAERYLVEKES